MAANKDNLYWFSTAPYNNFEWRGQHYLINTATASNFYHHYNQGFDTHYLVEYLIAGQRNAQDSSALDKTQLFKEWQDFFLEKPIEAKIIAINKAQEREFEIKTLFTLDKGKNQGIKKTFRFYHPKYSAYFLTIVEVKDNTSIATFTPEHILKIHNIATIGEVFSTSTSTTYPTTQKTRVATKR
jgi:hypothetical protein